MAANNTLYEQFMSQGFSAAWDMEWGKAADYYRQALNEVPGDLSAQSNLAAALFELEDYDESLRQYTRVAEVTPNDPMILEKISRILEIQGEYTQAAEVAMRVAEIYLQSQDVEKMLESLSRCIELNPEHLMARSRMALTNERLGRSKQAVTQYLSVASLLQHGGQKEKAIELVTHALQILPDSTEARQALGLLRANQLLPKVISQYRGTMERTKLHKPLSTPLLTVAKKTEPEKIDPVADARQRAVASLADMVFEQSEHVEQDRTAKRDLGDIVKGTGPLAKVFGERAKIMLHLSQAIDLQTRGDEVQAAAELERAMDEGLESPAANFDLGLMRIHIGRLESALRNLQQSSKHPDYALASRLLLAQVFSQLKRFLESAIEYLEALRQADAQVVDPSQANELFQLYEPIIENHKQEVDDEKHIKLCESIKALLMRPDWHDQVFLARQQLPPSSPGMPPVPLAELLTYSQSSKVLEILSEIHQKAREGHLRLAMEEALRAVQYAPTYLPLHIFMGELLFQMDHIENAIAKFNTVARAYSARGEAAKAIDLFRRITQLAPLDIATRKQLIDQLSASGRNEETVRELLAMGDVYYRLAELDKAREAFQAALNFSQQSGLDNTWTIEVLQHMADIDLQRLDWRRALNIFKHIHRLDPDNKDASFRVIDLNLRLQQTTQALAELGNYVAYLNQEGNYATTIELLEQLLQNNPDQIAIRKTLAEQYQKGGKTREAIEQLDIIGDVLLEAGDRQGAIQTIRTILSLKPPNSAEYEQALAELQSSG